MTPVDPHRLRMDFYGLHPRLVWANERTVEPEFQKSGETRGGTDTVAWLILEGGATVTYESGTARAGAGQWMFLRAENGRQRFTRGSRLISMRFHLRLRGGELLFAPRRDVIVASTDHPRLEQTARALVAEFARVNALGTLWVARERLNLVDNFRIESAFMAWLGAYVDAMEIAGETPAAAGERDERVVKALTLIEEHRMRVKFSEAALARHCGLSINQLGRVFRSEMGMSPYQYYERQRLDFARHALAESKLPVKEIGFELGFGSSAHFSNWFAAKTGHGPRAYRTQHSGHNTRLA
jgi:AraC-like DNA-binding protein